MAETRKATNKLIDLASEGALSWEAIARACLGYMSEYEVNDMAESEGFIEVEEEEEDNDTDEDDDDEEIED